MTTSVVDIAVTTAWGEEKPLKDYLGNVLLIVNVASYCGYTPQYKGLEALNEKYRDAGLRILAFPCNDFGAQEPDNLEKIEEFCSTNYGVTFDLLDKVHAKGPEQHPLYARLTQGVDPQGEVAWNFEKFLIDRSGNAIARFKSAVSPDSPELVNAIEAALKG
ncbi:glutathione peroxidase [Pseudanabaena sp. FACHB-2040]|uniref:glutathione peroxidase n=1 Tax=Pseudanabaena sp. FACHB-2040 TaxID=2692859 RepID=UPI001688EDDA|nr:glutathione peroxidase [Pseudanabaena sp. FACHB-2040]MBD0269824.1 glutathione peroxidase [Cyanobacteria bacterium Co-bin8]MBD2259526.1 glutathione peroxidase [Pseudanabaena sp. FACHB-2040]